MVPGEDRTGAWSGWRRTGFRLATFGGSRLTYVKYSVLGVVFVLNSATGTPLEAIRGPNMAAGYTMEEVPTCMLTGSPWKRVENAWLKKKRRAWYAFENPPQGKGHTLPSLFPLWSGCESPWFLQKIPCWASADRCNRSCHTLTAAGKTARRYQITSFLNKLRPFQKWFYNSPYSCSQCNLFWRRCGSMWTFPLTLTYWSFSGWKSEQVLHEKKSGRLEAR